MLDYGSIQEDKKDKIEKDEKLLSVTERTLLLDSHAQEIQNHSGFRAFKSNAIKVLRAPSDYLIVSGIHGLAIVLTELNPQTAKFDDNIIQYVQLPFSATVGASSLFLLHKHKISNARLKQVLGIASGLFYETFKLGSTTAFGILGFTQLEGTIFGIIAKYQPDYVSGATYYPPFAALCLLSLSISIAYDSIKYSNKRPEHLIEFQNFLERHTPNFLNKIQHHANALAHNSMLKIALNSFVATTTLYSLPIIFNLPADPDPSLKERIILTGVGLLGGSILGTGLSVLHHYKKGAREFIDNSMDLVNLLSFAGLTAHFYMRLNKDEELNISLLITNIVLITMTLIVSGALTASNLCANRNSVVDFQDVEGSSHDKDETSSQSSQVNKEEVVLDDPSPSKGDIESKTGLEDGLVKANISAPQDEPPKRDNPTSANHSEEKVVADDQPPLKKDSKPENFSQEVVDTDEQSTDTMSQKNSDSIVEEVKTPSPAVDVPSVGNSRFILMPKSKSWDEKHIPSESPNQTPVLKRSYSYS